MKKIIEIIKLYTIAVCHYRRYFSVFKKKKSIPIGIRSVLNTDGNSIRCTLMNPEHLLVYKVSVARDQSAGQNLCRGQILVIFCAASQKSLRTTVLYGRSRSERLAAKFGEINILKSQFSSNRVPP